MPRVLLPQPPRRVRVRQPADLLRGRDAGEGGAGRVRGVRRGQRRTLVVPAVEGGEGARLRAGDRVAGDVAGRSGQEAGVVPPAGGGGVLAVRSDAELPAAAAAGVGVGGSTIRKPERICGTWRRPKTDAGRRRLAWSRKRPPAAGRQPPAKSQKAASTRRRPPARPRKPAPTRKRLPAKRPKRVWPNSRHCYAADPTDATYVFGSARPVVLPSNRMWHRVAVKQASLTERPSRRGCAADPSGFRSRRTKALPPREIWQIILSERPVEGSDCSSWLPPLAGLEICACRSWGCGTAVTSRAKRAALLKLYFLILYILKLLFCHQPRETRGPIETSDKPHPTLSRRAEVTSRAKRAALLKLYC